MRFPGLYGWSDTKITFKSFRTSQSEHVCGANTIRKNRKRSELASLSISMKKKGRKNWRSHLLKRGYGVVNSDLTTDLWLCQLRQVLLVFFFRLDFSITLWWYSLELHRFSQYRVTELRHICIHGCLTHTAGCELGKRWKYTSLFLFQPCFLCHSRK